MSPVHVLMMYYFLIAAVFGSAASTAIWKGHLWFALAFLILFIYLIAQPVRFKVGGDEEKEKK